MHRIKTFALIALTLASASVFANTTVTSAFGPTNDTFGGTGIPNNAVATTTITNSYDGGNNSVTLALTATPRYFSPALTNNGAGVFYATAGAYSPGSPLALWNYDFSVTGDTDGPYHYKLFVDLDPSVGNPLSSYQSFALSTDLADSENLGFFGSSEFNPAVSGQYGFVLEALNVDNTVIGSTSILVDVGSVPEPASLALIGVGLLGAFCVSRRRRPG